MNLRLLLPAIVSLLLWNSAWSAEDYQTPRTEWNQPDLQGVWNFSSDIPMQRPAQYGEREFLTEEEVAEIRARRVARDDFSDAAIPNGGVNEAYNDFWVETAGIGDVARTSIIVYPENGRLPPYAEGAVVVQGRLDPDIDGERPVRFTGGGIGSDGPEDRGLGERCIVGFNSGPPFTPSLYNNNVQIIQSKNTAVILTEMIHDARIIPLGEKPDLSDDIRLWSGDSRGWYEGDTLVVETKNFNGLRQSLNYSFVGTNSQTVLTEKFTRNSFDSVDYEFTIDDPGTFTDKVTAIIPLTKVAGQLYEYACHEGNYGMKNLLRGKRFEDSQSSDE